MNAVLKVCSVVLKTMKTSPCVRVAKRSYKSAVETVLSIANFATRFTCPRCRSSYFFAIKLYLNCLLNICVSIEYLSKVESDLCFLFDFITDERF